MFSKKTYRGCRWMELVIKYACYPMDPDLQHNVAEQLYENWHTVRDDYEVRVLWLVPPWRHQRFAGKASSGTTLVRIKNGRCQCMLDGALVPVDEGSICVQQKDVS